MAKREMVFHKPLEFHKFHVADPDGARPLIFSYSESDH